MKFKIEDISSQYLIKQLTESHIPEICTLCKSNPVYYEYMKTEPTPETIKEVFTALPPGKTMEDKFFVGFYKGRQLIAIMDLIIGYPDIKTTYIGWFMVDKDFQGNGIGTVIIKEALSILKEENFSAVRLGCIKENEEGKKFWLKNGFHATGTESKADNYTVLNMQKYL